jgi:hypothetical protein
MKKVHHGAGLRAGKAAADFVQQEKLRRRGQRARNFQALLLTQRER